MHLDDRNERVRERERERERDVEGSSKRKLLEKTKIEGGRVTSEREFS